MFTEKEVAYINAQRLARIATVAQDGQPDVSPVGFEYDGTHFFIGGRDVTNTRKYKNILETGPGKAALVIDDIESIVPWRPRGVRVYGNVELVEHDGKFGHTMYIRLTPQTSWSWNIEAPYIVEGRYVRHKTTHMTPVDLPQI